MSEDRSPGRAVVTGGTGALGRGVVAELLGRGWEVRVPWVDEGEVELLEERLGGRPKALTLGRADVTDARAFDDFLGDEPVDALCALVGGFAMDPLEDTDDATWDRMVRLNATAPFVAAREVVRRMKARGTAGRIVFVTALPAIEGGGGRMAAYAATKSAVVGLTRALAEELRPDGVTVNAIAPEIIDTPANRNAMPDADTSRWLAPSEIARVVAFLVSEDAAVVTGSVLALRKG